VQPNLGLIAQIDQLVRAKKLFRRGEKILVAASGGVDSMVLLAVLHRLATAHEWQLFVAHFNHQLRGKAADADEQLVRDAAKTLGWPAVISRGSVKEHARRRGWSVEMAARELRHTFLAQTAKRSGASAVALAHHADDQIETFFLRLLRGAGNRGLGGMVCVSSSPVDKNIRLVRPLLNQSKAALEEFARDEGIRFSEDATNADLDILRNRVRHELLPLLRKNYQPALNSCILRLMELARSSDDVVQERADQWLAARRRKPFTSLASAVQRELIQRQLHELGQVVDFETVERLRTHPDQPVSANASHHLILALDGRVSLHPLVGTGFDPKSLIISLDDQNAGQIRFHDVKLDWELADESGMSFRRQPNEEHFDADKVGPEICLRHWKPGDRFHPIGAGAAAKLQDIFTNLKVPRGERRRRLLATTGGGEIFWVEGLRIGDAFKLDKTTVRRLNWRWRREEGGGQSGVAS